MTCPELSALQAHVEGFATSDEREQVRAHLEICAACRDLVLALAPDSPIPDEPSLRFDGGDAIEALEPAGQRIDRYVTFKHLGEGGMGVVYAAYDPELDRKVALKLIRPMAIASEQATRQMRERLLREAQAMARVAHANVAAVYDVGRHEGQVFIAMELIEGETLTRWLARTPRSPAEILRVFVGAARGLAAAHAAKLVHRDFKPNNVMIDGNDRARVLDFGLARPAGLDEEVLPSSSPSRVDQSLTAPGVLLGTPAYMSPEQLGREPADARSDQFSFCVALYEALCGTRPFVADDTGELRATILARKIERPLRNVSGRLMRVIARGLEAAPAARWPTMDELIAEMAHDPVPARRRWLGVGGALLALAGVAIVQQRAKRAHSPLCHGQAAELAGIWDAPHRQLMHTAFTATGKSYAEDAFAGAARALDNYTRDWSAMSTDSCEATRVRGEQSEEALDLRSECLSRRREGLRALVDVFEHADGKIVEKAVQAAGALEPLDECANVALLKLPVRPPKDPATRARVEEVRREISVAKALRDAGKFSDGLPIAKRAVTDAHALAYSPVEAEAMLTEARLEEKNGAYQEAEETLLRASAAAITGHDEAMTAQAWSSLVFVVCCDEHRPADAHPWELLARAAVERVGSERAKIQLLNNRGGLSWEQGKYDEALALYREVIALRQKVLGPEHPDVASGLSNLGGTLEEMGKHEEALDADQRALAIREKVLGAHHPAVGNLLSNMSVVLLGLARFDEALVTGRRALGILEAALPPMHPDIASALNNIGLTLAHSGNDAEALIVYRRAYTIFEKSVGPDNLDTLNTLGNIGHTLDGLGRSAEALPMLRRVAEIRERALGPRHLLVGDALARIGATLENLGRHAEALAFYRRSVDVVDKAMGSQSGYAAHPLTGVGEVLLAMHDAKSALAPLERALILSATETPESLAETRFALAQALWETHDRERAHTLAAQAADAYEEAAKHFGGRSVQSANEVRVWLAAHRTPAQ